MQQLWFNIDGDLQEFYVPMLCSLKTGPFIMRVFRAIFLAGRRSGRHESIEVFGRSEGVYS
ncbi:hypothetical protein, partial [Brucella lupini]|uniref:hypothetical protein n=1 Tax=Brucella lupini TaxID=255457 RepID=UPI001AEE35E6